jgi:peptidoglycan/LPS O-acetylase OafA/YrhL
MVGVLYCFHNYLLGPIVVPFGRTLIGASAAAIIIISIRNPHSLIFSWLNWAPVAFVGVLSYSLYIWQQLFVTKAELYGLETVPWFLSPELFLLPLFAVAYGMHMAVERPFLSMKNRMFKKVDDKKLFSDDAEPAGKAEDNTASFRSGDGL